MRCSRAVTWQCKCRCVHCNLSVVNIIFHRNHYSPLFQIFLVNVIFRFVTTAEVNTGLANIFARPPVEGPILYETDEGGESSARAHHDHRMRDFEWKSKLRPGSIMLSHSSSVSRRSLEAHYRCGKSGVRFPGRCCASAKTQRWTHHSLHASP